MTITLEEVDALDDVAFDRIFASSLPHMDNGTFDWDMHQKFNQTVLETEEQKKEFVRLIINTISTNGQSQLCLVSKDNYPIVYFISENRDVGYHMPIFLAGPDVNGSKAYVYSEELREAVRNHVKVFSTSKVLNFVYANQTTNNNSLQNVMNSIALRDTTTKDFVGVDPNPNVSDENIIRLIIGDD